MERSICRGIRLEALRAATTLTLLAGCFTACVEPAASAASTERASSTQARSTTQTDIRVFSRMCDASGAVPLSATRLAVADDEDNVLRIYDADAGGAPLHTIDVSKQLDLVRGKKKYPETDIEAATLLGDVAYWITSHGRNSSGKLKPERFRFFATTLPSTGEIRVIGTYDKLLDQLLADTRFARLGLREAAARAPKAEGGLNIEGMTARPEGGVWIGFRNPIPEGRALLFVLQNPERVVAGERPKFGDPVGLDLGGLGVRSLSWWHGRYLIAAGHYGDSKGSRLFVWDGRSERAEPLPLVSADLNPEAFFTPEERSEFLVLSDDGSQMIDGVACKRLREVSRKTFRGQWIRPSYGAE